MQVGLTSDKDRYDQRGGTTNTGKCAEVIWGKFRFVGFHLREKEIYGVYFLLGEGVAITPPSIRNLRQLYSEMSTHMFQPTSDPSPSLKATFYTLNDTNKQV